MDSKLTPIRCKAILRLIEAGAFPTSAGLQCGVTRGTISNWLNSSLPAYKKFQDDVAAAEAKNEQSLLECIQKAAPRDWKAALALIERRHKAGWSKDQVIRVETNKAQAAAEELKKISDADLQRLAAVLEDAERRKAASQQPPNTITFPAPSTTPFLDGILPC